ncbi:hypothetical protein M9H77_05646 [Catharanthus roseus]|uniref:Uncharacterized protein n=1 Tax=Catharanthus roseus TaxID=4058 RepID=A0ACC0CI10_CATRO|nr:hypothetical protein M9H77_05646 [Catharanthus roseus]
MITPKQKKYTIKKCYTKYHSNPARIICFPIQIPKAISGICCAVENRFGSVEVIGAAHILGGARICFSDVLSPVDGILMLLLQNNQYRYKEVQLLVILESA